jgi:Flp pilus assembly protein TadD
LILLLAACLGLGGTWAYSTSFAGVLVLDDVRAIARNPTIRSLPASLAPPAATTVSGRPVGNLTLAINYALAPADARDVFFPAGPGAPPDAAQRFLRNVWGYHFLNLVIHLASGLALFGVVRRTLLSDRLRTQVDGTATWLAFVVALVWLVHPLQTEAVTYVVQRVESLAGLFYLLTLYCAIRAPGSRRARLWSAGAIAACALGMATKEVTVTAPIAVWLWDRTFGGHAVSRPRWPLLAGLAATWLVLGLLVFHEHRAPSIVLGQGMVWRYLVTQAGVITHYLRLAITGTPLVFLYTWPLAGSLGALAPQAALVAALVILTGVGIVRRHPLGYAGGWFFLILAPTSSVLPIVTEVAAEHRMYLPLAAVVACVVVGVYRGGRLLLARIVPAPPVRRATGAALGAALTVAVVLAYGTETRARNRDYWSEETLWADTVDKQPDNARARVGYGVALLTARRPAEAEAQLRVAVDLDRADGFAHERLGAALATQGKLDEAIPRFQRAVALRPGLVDAQRSLGLAYATLRQGALALPHLERALAALPDDPVLLRSVAAVLVDPGDLSIRDIPRALVLAGRAVTLTARRDGLALDVLAVAQAGAGRFADAASTAEEALWLARAQGNRALVQELEYHLAAYRARRDGR